jgi:aconitate hydratase
VRTVEAYAKAQGLWRDDSLPISYGAVVELDQSTIVPSLAGPSRPQDRVDLPAMQKTWQGALPKLKAGSKATTLPTATALAEDGAAVMMDGQEFILKHGAVVIAAITSCTNTSNPSVMIGAGLLAKKARQFGLERKPWVKSSLAPGSKVVTEYLNKAGLQGALDELGFQTVGYGCTTCIGNSGPLPEAIESAIKGSDLVVASVLSGNRNFEARVHQDVKANYLASPPLVVAYAIAGTVDIDLQKDPIGIGKDGSPVYLRDVWPSQAEVDAAVKASVTNEQFRTQYADVFRGSAEWQAIRTGGGDMYSWDAKSTYIQEPPFFTTMTLEEPGPIGSISGARVLAKLGDSITTDHISPAGNIKKDGPAGSYLQQHGVPVSMFNSYGSRRGNDRVMTRGTFANTRIQNQLAPGTTGGVTMDFTDGQVKPIFDAAERSKALGIPLIVLAGKDYGMGSSRDWAAKGTYLLGVKAVIAESFERIHRSNLVGMGVLPLCFLEGQSAASLGLDGSETFDIDVPSTLKPRQRLKVVAKGAKGVTAFEALCRIDTPVEIDYYRNGGILQTVLRAMARA